MYKQTANPQALFSMQLMSDALFRLMEHDSFADITILQICQEAEIARKTFYRNLASKEDILIFTADRLLQDFIKEYSTSCTSLEQEVSNCYTYLYRYKDFLQLLHRDHLLYTITDKLKAYLQQSGCAAQLEEETKLPFVQPYYDHFLASSIISILELWIERDFRESIAELLELTLNLFTKL